MIDLSEMQNRALNGQNITVKDVKNASRQKIFRDRMKQKGFVLVRAWIPVPLIEKWKEFVKSIGEESDE